MDSLTKIENKILVEIEALLDTRLATIGMLYPQIADNIINNTPLLYATRVSDEMGEYIEGVSTEDYKKAYNERGNRDTIKFSFLTAFTDELHDIIADIQKKASMGHPGYGIPVLDINIYPYTLTADECTELVDTLCEISGLTDDQVSIVNIPYAGLTLDYMRLCNYNVAVFYNLTTWLYESLSTTNTRPDGFPSLIVISPTLFETRKVLEDPEIFRMPNGKYLDPFDTTTNQLADLLSLRFIDVSRFCMAGITGEPKDELTR